MFIIFKVSVDKIGFVCEQPKTKPKNNIMLRVNFSLWFFIFYKFNFCNPTLVFYHQLKDHNCNLNLFFCKILF